MKTTTINKNGIEIPSYSIEIEDSADISGFSLYDAPIQHRGEIVIPGRVDSVEIRAEFTSVFNFLTYEMLGKLLSITMRGNVFKTETTLTGKLTSLSMDHHSNINKFSVDFMFN